MSPKILAILILALPALVLKPLERRIDRERAVLKYGGAPVSLAVRERVGQGMAIGLLAGFRGVVADFLWIQNHGFWEELWQPTADRELLVVRMYRNMTTVVLLQPHAVFFWHTGAWHMAWNMGSAARRSPKLHTNAERHKRDWEWREKGREFLEDGLKNNPDSWLLHFHMGWLYGHKLADTVNRDAEREALTRASEYFLKASQLEGANSQAPRMYAVMLEKIGNPQAAYEYWKKEWRNGNPRQYADRIPMRFVIEHELRRLENDLKIPSDQRLFPEQPAPNEKSAA